MHSAEGETRELAVASLERAVANLQRVEKAAPRLDTEQLDGQGLLMTLSHQVLLSELWQPVSERKTFPASSGQCCVSEVDN